jgi:hypothetical protein
MNAFNDAFLILSILLTATIPLALLLKKPAHMVKTSIR